MILDNPTISGSLQISGSTTILGTLSASVIVGDGSGLIGVTSYTDSDTLDYINSIGVVSGSAQITITESQISDLTHYTNSDTLDYINSIGVVSGSVNWDTLIGKPSGIVSSSTQLSTEISGAFLSTSASLASDIQNNDTRLSTLEGKTLVSSSNQISYTGIVDVPANIISSSTQLSDTTIPGDLTVSGILTAQEFHTEFVSASIIYQSGSTQFGNSTDDTHTFVGTISATTIQNVLSSSAQIDYDSIPNRVTNNNQLTNGAGYTTCIGDITGVTAGTGLSGGGTSGAVTVSHADTSTLTGAQGSAGISSITVDALGHVTAVTTATYCTTDTNTTYTANEMLTCIKTVDGTGSGLDADTLDGNQASAFYLATNPNGYTTCTGTLTGTGTSGYISKWNGSTSQTNSIIYDDGTNIGIGTTNPSNKLEVNGNLYIGGSATISDGTRGIRMFNDSAGTGNRSGIIFDIDVSDGIGVGSDYLIMYQDGLDESYILTPNAGSGNLNIRKGLTDLMTIKGTGNVGIGTASPNAKTVISNTIDTVYSNSVPSISDTILAIQNTPTTEIAGGHASIQFNVNAGSYNRVGSISFVAESSTSNYASLTFSTNASGTSRTEKMRITGAGNVGIGTTSPAEKLHVVGNIVATGNITGYYSSDERLKENKEVLKNPIEKINKISGYEFDWKEIPSYGVPKHDVGVIAQEIEEVLPEIVARREDGYLAVRYEKITPLLIEGIKELSKEVESLKDIIKNNGITK